MASAEQPNPQELFRDLSRRMAAMGVPVGTLLREAEAQQGQGLEGVFVELEPDEGGAGAIVTVNRETVDFKVGGQGPYALSLNEVKEITEPPRPQDSPPDLPQA